MRTPITLVVYFDSLQDAAYPNGTWACGIPGQDTYYGDTPEAALAAWRAANPKCQ
jgi:hypothetical protein